MTVPHDDPSGRVRRITTRALSVLGVAVAVAGLLFAARTLLEDRGRTADLLAEADWWWLVLLVRRRPGTSPAAGRTRGQLGREP